MIPGTLRDNLVYGLGHGVSDKEIQSALRRADCDFVFQLAQGLEHSLTEQGHGLSSGQKQRLSLARALLRRPTVLILDEPTANLDAQSESRLVEVFLELKKEMTILAATHREAVLAIADQRIQL